MLHSERGTGTGNGAQ